jgi:hypothetical protein
MSKDKDNISTNYPKSLEHCHPTRQVRCRSPTALEHEPSSWLLPLRILRSPKSRCDRHDDEYVNLRDAGSRCRFVFEGGGVRGWGFDLLRGGLRLCGAVIINL